MNDAFLVILDFLKPWFFTYSKITDNITIYSGLFDFTGIEIDIQPDLFMSNPQHIVIYTRKNYKYAVKIANKLRNKFVNPVKVMVY